MKGGREMMAKLILALINNDLTRCKVPGVNIRMITWKIALEINEIIFSLTSILDKRDLYIL